MRTGHALTVLGGLVHPRRNFGKKNWRPPEKLETPPWKIGDNPPKKMETPPLRKFGDTPLLLTESQTRVKILPWPNFIAASKNAYHKSIEKRVATGWAESRTLYMWEGI